MIRRGVLAVAVLLALAACSDAGSAARDREAPVAGSVVLAKADRWRTALGDDDEATSAYMVVEIAYDAAAARRAWAENVPSDLPTVTGPPYTAGRFAAFEDVDLARQRIVVVSGGQSGSCPGWVRGVTTRPDGTVDVLEGTHVPAGWDGCPADYNPYRTVLAVDADLLPARSALGYGRPAALVDGATIDSGVRVVAYPFEPLFPR